MGDEEKHFERAEAERLLPTIANLLETARAQKQQVKELDREFNQMQNRILLMGGIVPPYALLAEKRLEHDAGMTKIRESVSQIENLGCVVKDLDLGLVDFPTRRDAETVYLCWKLGEERIGYWHRTDEGYAGRKPLDSAATPPGGAAKPN